MITYIMYICVCLLVNDNIGIIPSQMSTRQSEMANTSPCHMPVLGNVHPIKIKNIDIFISLLARILIFLINGATQEVPTKNI